MKFRFPKFSNQVSALLCLISSSICSSDMNLDFQNIVSEYKDLPHHEITDQEIHLWKRHWLAQNEKIRQSTLATSLKDCKKNRYPNLYVLKLAALYQLHLASARGDFLQCEGYEHGFGHQCHHNDSLH